MGSVSYLARERMEFWGPLLDRFVVLTFDARGRFDSGPLGGHVGIFALTSAIRFATTGAPFAATGRAPSSEAAGRKYPRHPRVPFSASGVPSNRFFSLPSTPKVPLGKLSKLSMSKTLTTGS